MADARCRPLRGWVTVLAAMIATSGPVARADPPVGDATRGRQVFAGCRTCHYPEQGYGHHNGPSLYGVFGRRAGSAAGFEYYSSWLRQAGFTWTPELLDAWLANPAMFPESTMVFVAQPDAQARADLIAYLSGFRD